MRRVILAGCVLMMSPVAGAGQSPDLVSAVETARVSLRLFDSDSGRIWPGYRPDTIPLLFTSSEGVLLGNWRGASPRGFQRVGGTELLWCAATASCAGMEAMQFEGRPATTVGADTRDAARIAGEAAHEAFHVYERASIRPGVRFGRGENAMLVGRYPSFDAANEAAFAEEAEILQQAVQASNAGRSAELARVFLALRADRHSRLPAQMAEFERMAEINEGLAQYAQWRAWTAFARSAHGVLQHESAALSYRDVARLDSVLTMTNNSIRRRFYTTGTALGVLLDRFATDWKERMMASDSTLEQLLSTAVSFDPSRRDAYRAFAMGLLDHDAYARLAAASVASLRSERATLRDSIAALPGLKITIETSAVAPARIPVCGFDPNNMLAVDEAEFVHRRFVSLCVEGVMKAELRTGSVADEKSRTTTFAVDPNPLKTTAGGRAVVLRKLRGIARDLEIQGDQATVTIRRARLEWQSGRLILHVLPADK